MTTVVDQVITIFDAVWKGEGAAKSAALSLDSYRKMSADAALKHQHLATKIDATRSSMMQISGKMKEGKFTREEAIKEWERLEGKLGTYEQRAALVAKSQQTLGDRMKGMAATAGQAALVIGGVTLALKGMYEVGKKVYQLAEQGAGINQLYESFNRLNTSVMHTPNLLQDMQRETNYTISEVAAMEGIMTLVAGSSESLTQAFAQAAPKLAEIAKAANKLNPSLGDTNFMFASIARGIKRLEPRLLDNLGLNVRMKNANDAWAEANNRSVESMTAEEKVMAALNETLKVGANLIDQVGGTVESQVDPYLQLAAAADDYTNALKAQFGLMKFGQSTIAKNLRDQADNARLQNAVTEAAQKGLSTQNEYVRWTNAIARGVMTYEQAMRILLERQLQVEKAEQRIYMQDYFARHANDSKEAIEELNEEIKKVDFTPLTPEERFAGKELFLEPGVANKELQMWRLLAPRRKEIAEELVDSIDDQIKKIRELDAATGDYAMAAIDADKESSLFNQTIDEIGEAYVTVGGRTKEQNELLEDMQKAYEKTQKNIRDYSVGIKGVGQEQETVNKRMEGYNEQLGILAPQIEKLKGIQGDVVKVNREATWNQENINKAIVDAADAYGANDQALVAFMMGTGDLTDAQAEAVLEQAKMGEMIQEWGQKMADGIPYEEIIADVERVKQAISDLTLDQLLEGPPEVPEELIDTSRIGGVYEDAQNKAINPLIERLIGPDAQKAIENLENLREEAITVVDLDGYESTLGEINEIYNALVSIAKDWNINVDIKTSGGVPSPRTGNEPEEAFGGPLQQGASYFVGERGPELFVPNQNGYLYPTGTGPGNGVTNIYNYNKDAAAISMTMLGMRRRQGVDSLAGLA